MDKTICKKVIEFMNSNDNDYILRSAEGIKKMLNDDRITFQNALKNNEFVVYYQPQIDIYTGKLTGAEALLRWNRVDGVQSPALFLDAAKACNMLGPLSDWVLGESCKQNREWLDDGYDIVPISINIILEQFRYNHLLEVVREFLDITKLPSEFIEIELTEKSDLTKVDESIPQLNQIAKDGINIAIDDFGTGHSSYRHINEFPISKIKIDKAFADNIETVNGIIILESIINLAHRLGHKVVVEGVERELQVEILKMIGCDIVQGYYYSKPLPADEFKAKYLTRG